ncbi:MAG: hypothetical protein QQN43_07230 [Nitrosopumilus sp.]
MKNINIAIPIVVGIIIVIVGVIALTNQESDVMEVEDAFDKELKPNEEIIPEIEEKLDEIEKTNLENKYTQKPREWITSGPFQIDRNEYVLGEKIFVRVGGLSSEEKGQIAFLRPLNDTHHKVYLTISFDGTERNAFNQYFQPQLSKINGFCTVDDFVGEWRVVFRGTEYADLTFKITEDILPGDESSYEPVC